MSLRDEIAEVLSFNSGFLRRMAFPCACGLDKESAAEEPCACTGAAMEEIADDLDVLPDRLEQALEAALNEKECEDASRGSARKIICRRGTG